MDLQISPELIISGTSLLVTGYFWFVRSRKERPNLQFYQLSHFRTFCRSVPDRKDIKRLSFQQLGEGGVLIVNHSLRQNSIVLFECFLQTGTEWIKGDWGYSNDDRPPWNVGPETSIAFSPACFFDVPADYEMPEDPVFYLRFMTASGRSFSHRFAKHAVALTNANEEGPPQRLAA